MSKSKFKDLIFYPDERLNQVSEEITEFGPELEELVKKMIEIAERAEGMGLSAIQIGIPKRVFVMKPKGSGEWIACINPVIRDVSQNKADLMEGCLSAPGVYAKVKSRTKTVVVEYRTTVGLIADSIFEGIDAVCFQHELDHLNGIFFFEGLNRESKRKANNLWKKVRKKLGL